MKISFIIPAYNEEAYLGDCLDSLFSEIASAKISLPALETEVIVVNNASIDRTKEIATSKGARVVDESAKGLTHARDAGRKAATGEILAYLDADTRVIPGWIEKIVDAFKNPKVVCFSGSGFYYDIPMWQRMFVKAYWYLGAMPVYWYTGYMVYGAHFAIRKETIDKMGGFDTTITFYGEDTNIARRASDFGKVKFSPTFMIATSGRRLSGQGAVKTGVLYVANFFSEAFLRRPVTNNYIDIR